MNDIRRFISIVLLCFLPGIAEIALPQARMDPLRVVFIELGSVNCIPCKKMQPVMASVEKKYGEQIKVVFHDVWKAESKHYAKTFGIRVIPTQVFLDREGKEFFRHEGFFPESEIDSLLKKQGLKIQGRG